MVVLSIMYRYLTFYSTQSVYYNWAVCEGELWPVYVTLVLHIQAPNFKQEFV